MGQRTEEICEGKDSPKDAKIISAGKLTTAYATTVPDPLQMTQHLQSYVVGISVDNRRNIHDIRTTNKSARKVRTKRVA
jgi:hypothetical protein